MIIERNLANLIVFSEDTVLSALSRIGENKLGVVFCVSSSGALEGVLSDGDVRRWLTAGTGFDPNARAIDAANRDFTALPDHSPIDAIERTFSDRIAVIPLIDAHRHLVGVARRGRATLNIGGFEVRDDGPSFIIAEIGNNHNGSLEAAKLLIEHAAEAGAHSAKFQMRSMKSLYRNAGAADDLSADLGAQYTLDLLARFQLTNDQLFEAFDHTVKLGLIPLCTPWDADSLVALNEYGLPGFKLASADLTNHDLLTEMAQTGKPLICSTGMSSESEIEEAVAVLRKHTAPYALLHCNSTYPAPFKDVNLRYLDRLKTIGDCVVGYSGHERGINVAVAAVARGARIIEKHLTVDRGLEGNDHRVSLLPHEFKQMVAAIGEVSEALGSDGPRRLTQGELMNREVLAKSLVAAHPIKAGDVLDANAIDVRSPGQGLPPYRRRDLIGRVAVRDMAAGDFFFPTDLVESAFKPRGFKFRRPWGVPVRYHDLKSMAAAAPMDLVEFHLSYKDMEEDVSRHLGDEVFDLDLVVHAPELFAGDHVMDLASDDEAHRRRSIDELRKVIDVTRALKPHFGRATRPMIIINAGGFSQDGFLPTRDRAVLYERVRAALAEVDQEGVEIIPQTMPPFPWHFGGQRYHNLFMAADEIDAFARDAGYRVCLDISHSQLAATHAGQSFQQFLYQVGPHSAHLHIVDAEGVDGEGLQIGEGAIDFGMVGRVLDEVAPHASFIPEIWQGHKNNGSGFWQALDALEQWL